MKQIDQREKKNIIFKFSFAFIILAGVMLLLFAADQNSFIWKIDGIGQYYPVFLYIGEYVRKTAASFFSGHFTIPQFDLSIGMGEDIIGCLNYYGFGDPMNLISVFATHSNGQYLYAARYLLGLYMAGFSFLCYCRKVNISDSGALLGSLTYSFCGFAICGALRYLEWISVLFYLPLMIAGAEDAIRNNRYALLTFSACYGALCGFYYLYMSSIALAVYCLIRMIYEFGNARAVIRKCFLCLGAYMLGICIAAPILFPALRAYLGSERKTDILPVITNIKLYIPDIHLLHDFLKASIIPSGGNYNYSSGILLIEWIVILAYLGKGKSAQVMQMGTGFLLILIAVMLPITGWLFNGFGESNDRWVFLIHFVFSVIFSSAVSEIWAEKWPPIIIRFRRTGYRLLLFLVMANISLNLIYTFQFESGSGWQNEFIHDSRVSYYISSPVDFVSLTDRKENLYRISTDSLTDVNGRPENVAMLNDYYGLTYWFSIINQNTQNYVDASNGETMNWRSYGFRQQIFTEALAGTKYYCSKEVLDQGKGYILTDRFLFQNETWFLYRNPYYLGFAYTSENPDEYHGDSSLEDYSRSLYQTCSSEDISDIHYDNRKNTFLCHASASDSEKLIIAIPYSSDWTAYIDGTKVQTDKFNMYILLNLPEGEHDIALHYSNSSFILGLLTSAVSLIFLIYCHKRKITFGETIRCRDKVAIN